MGESGKGPSRLRSFDPARIGDLEYRAWVAYYRRQWVRLLVASVGLVHAGFGMDWLRTLHGAWLVLRQHLTTIRTVRAGACGASTAWCG